MTEDAERPAGDGLQVPLLANNRKTQTHHPLGERPRGPCASSVCTPWLQEPFLEFAPNMRLSSSQKTLVPTRTAFLGSLQADTHLCIRGCLDKPLSEVLLFHLCSRTPRTAMFIYLLVGKHCLIHWVPVNQRLSRVMRQNEASL